MVARAKRSTAATMAAASSADGAGVIDGEGWLLGGIQAL